MISTRWLVLGLCLAGLWPATVPEKFNVETGSHEVFAEYGNVGDKFEYIAPEGFGWMNASFEVGLTFLSERRLEDFRNLQPPPRPLE